MMQDVWISASKEDITGPEASLPTGGIAFQAARHLLKPFRERLSQQPHKSFRGVWRGWPRFNVR